MAKSSAQKFIARNRAPRVQIEYDLETEGGTKVVDLPFVMGVMADLSGKPAEALPSVTDRKFLEIDVDNFNDRLKASKPRVAFQVPNTLTGEGNINVEMTFESMDDFSPAAVARKVDALNKLLQTRTELANLLTYMDGKDKAEALIGKLLNNQDLMKSLASVPNPEAKPANP
jgi:type VI secretion system protein ImpB